MKKLVSVISILFLSFIITGCYETIPPGYVGKKISVDGVLPEIHETGRVWVKSFPEQRLIFIETSSQLRVATATVNMADYRINSSTGEMERVIGLPMDFTINIRYRLDNRESNINAMMQDMSIPSNVNVIQVQNVYNKYGNMVVGRVSREVLSDFTPEEVLPNLEAINKELHKKIKNALENSPLEISSVSLGPITLPPTISDRIQKNKETELSEAEKRAAQKIAMLEKTNQLNLAKQQANIDRVKAESMANQNKILNQSLSDGVLELRRLEIREKEIEMMQHTLPNTNSAVYIPYGDRNTVGVQNRMYSK